jgi:hypothetical protein
MMRRAEQAEELDQAMMSAAAPHAPAFTLVPTPAEEPRGTHVMKGEALAEQRRGVHVMKSQVPAGEPFGAHVMKREASRDRSYGAHVSEGDPLLSVEHRALHASKAVLLATPEFGPFPPEAETVVCGASNPAAQATDSTLGHEAAPSLPRRARRTKGGSAHARVTRRWGLVPIAGAAGVLVAGLGGGAAFAVLVSQGSGMGQTTTGSPVSIGITATTGSADLLPGRAGTAYFTLHNTASSAATFDQVTSGATVVSDNTDRCASSYVSIAQTLPYTLPTAITVSPGGTSGVQSIADLVQLAPAAPGTCQGVTFTVTLTLSGPSS